MLEVDVAARRGALDLEVAFRLPPGRLVALFGPSGAGKSTTLLALAGLLPSAKGRIAWSGTPWLAPGHPTVPAWRRPVALLTQEPFLLRRRSVRHNLLLVPGATGAAADRLLAELGLERRAAAPAASLSGGEAHLVALARVLLRPHVLALLDEPWAHLDRALRDTIARELLRRLATPERLVLLVSHDWDEVEALAETVVLLERGRVRAVASPEALVRRPPSPELAPLFGYVGETAFAGRRYLVHPGRLLPGSHPERGVVLPVTPRPPRPSHGRRLAAVALPGEVVVVLPTEEAPDHVTLLDPPEVR